MAGSVSATTLGAIALGTSAIGTGVGVMGSLQQATAAKNAAAAQQASANYQAEVAQGNAAIATQNATAAGQEGEAQAAIQQQKTRAEVGAEEAAQGSSGVDINSPTSTAVRASQAETGLLDAQTIRANAARTAYGYEVQATGYENQSAAEIATGQNDVTAGNVAAEGDITSGVSSGLSGIGNAGLNYSNVINKSSGLGASDQADIAAAQGGVAGESNPLDPLSSGTF